jgi:hypothetical protein
VALPQLIHKGLKAGKIHDEGIVITGSDDRRERFWPDWDKGQVCSV